MKCFSRQSHRTGNLIALTLAIVVLITASLMYGCQNTTSVPRNLGKVIDTTEDLHHRLKSGIFVPETDPVLFYLKKRNPKKYLRLLPFYNERETHIMARLSWAHGSFWVQANELELVVIYMDREAIFSHVQITASDEFRILRRFLEKVPHPIRTPVAW